MKGQNTAPIHVVARRKFRERPHASCVLCGGRLKLMRVSHQARVSSAKGATSVYQTDLPPPELNLEGTDICCALTFIPNGQLNIGS